MRPSLSKYFVDQDLTADFGQAMPQAFADVSAIIT